ncbi:hypothetical protein AG1IA_07409 [Rhizoctonia solani AG-1 IA]|uniref:Uncharacterized protein n=1 Tax=Thanatephorus cucumeris (strain AG1-IA) TaxID=983506 RepID=L8WK35_THACA|nr:hypothetical protein AG1IA_07409 [Rhizoctonia solani AG-1 IA]
MSHFYRVPLEHSSTGVCLELGPCIATDLNRSDPSENKHQLLPETCLRFFRKNKVPGQDRPECLVA